MASGATGWDGVLEPGERILWQGQPHPGVRRQDLDLKETAMGGLFAGFSVFWMYMAAQNSALFALFGLPFFAVGLRMMFRGWVNSYIRTRTWYTLTSQRAFIATDLPWRSKTLDAYPLTQNTVFEFDQSDTPATIWFTRRYRTDATGKVRGRKGFERVPDAEAVYAQMRAVQRGEA